MRIDALVFAVIAPFMTGCGGCCFPPREPFAIDRGLREEELTALLGERDPMQQRLTCENLCEVVHNAERSWYVSHVVSCKHSIRPPQEVEPGGIAAHVQCRGEAVEYFCKGRRPLGHVEQGASDAGLGGYLARCAHLEGASVAAFDQLAGQLAEVGAPAGLIDRCRAAAVEEARHAAVIGRLAEAYGGRVRPAERRAVAPSLRAIALHNAVEGCVFEAWAAVEAAWQGRHAADPELRAAYAVIAFEEAGHAQLAWDLHAWLLGQLDEEARAEVVALQRAAIARLPRVAAGVQAPAELGMPDAGTIAAMASRFAAGLAAAA